MATLTQNLQSIYNTKLQIKEVIGTQSDVFSEYPSLIEDALENAGGGGITPTGYTSITTNGQYDVTTYAYAYVSVPTGGGSGYYYPVHTVSDVTSFEPELEYMWLWSANELDEESGDFSSAVFTNKYWSYCYPQEIEIMENPVLNFDNFDMGFSMVSYTNLVKREYDFNSLPDYNTYRGYTYSYEYPNPEYDPELGNEEYLTYEFNYGADLLYSTTLNIASLSDREIVSPNGHFNGVWRVFDDSQPGLTGYYDETEYGECNYANQQWLSIGCLSPAETDGGPVTQFTTTYHGAASYTTGFDPRTLCGYVWQAVVDGRGWLVDLIDNDGDLVFSEMRLSDGDDENAAYLDADRDDFIQEIELSDSNTTFDGLYIYAVDDSGDYTKNYKLHINDLNAYDLLGDEQITVGESCNADVTIDNASPNLIVDMSGLSNYYNDWSITLELVIPNTIRTGSVVMLRVTAFTGEPNQ